MKSCWNCGSGCTAISQRVKMTGRELCRRLHHHRRRMGKINAKPGDRETPQSKPGFETIFPMVKIATNYAPFGVSLVRDKFTE